MIKWYIERRNKKRWENVTKWKVYFRNNTSPLPTVMYTGGSIMCEQTYLYNNLCKTFKRLNITEEV